MAKKKTADEHAAGRKVRVKEGTTVPEFPDVSCAGWSGTIVETTGKKPDLQCVIEWDDATLGLLPPAYVAACEQKNLYYKMACLSAAVLDPVE